MVHVLIATDGSELAQAAARAAFTIVPAPKKVTLLAVSEATPEIVADGGGIEGPTMTPDELEALLAESNRHADAALLGLSTLVPDGVDLDRVLEHGDPGATIVAVSERVGADVVVVGSHGKGWLKRVVLGSVSAYVVHHAPCPVLVVPAKPETDDAAPEADAAVS
jgi:nucleotide-binding universal stress UspA family protein